MVEHLKERGVTGKCWINRKGVRVGGTPFERTAVYYLLSNPTYLGAIRHKKQIYADAHPPIIDRALWDEVQSILRLNSPNHPNAAKVGARILLKDKVFDPRGVPMAATHAVKNGRHYRYYTARDIVHGGASAARRMSRIQMGVLDSFLLQEVPQRLQADYLPDLDPRERTRAAVLRVQVTEEAITIRLSHESASSQINHLSGRVQTVDEGIEVTLPTILKHKSSATIIEASNASSSAGRVDRALVRAIALATSWADRLATGEISALSSMAKDEGYCDRYAGKLLPLAWLAPDLTEMILQGRQPRAISLGALTKYPLPLSWEEQRQLFHKIGTGAPV